MDKLTTLLYYENIINIFLQGNILNIELMGSLTNKIMDDMCIKLELFFDICKKKIKNTIKFLIYLNMIYYVHQIYYTI